MTDNQMLLTFTQSILSEMRIRSQLVSFPFTWEDNFDNGLRKAIYTDSDYQIFRRDIAVIYQKICEEHILSRCTDRFGCEYIFLRLPETSGPVFFVAGPFTYTPFTVVRAYDYCQRAGLPEDFQDFMQQYYVSLPVISEEHWMESLTGTLARSLWGDQKLSMPHLVDHPGKEHFKDNIDVLPAPTPSTAAYMESKYGSEDRLSSYIIDGNLEKIEEIRHRLCLKSIKQHFPDSLRDQKNNLIMFNTICRKAAQLGGVHPVWIDTEVNKFTTRIEYAVSLKQLDSIFREIPRKYCMLVRTYSVKNYSEAIQKVVTYIRLNPGTDLGLKKIAGHFSMNKNYLSTLFKKETGTGLTAFVNQERINYAIRLLNITRFPIGKVAELCGIEDLNYFSRLFKQQVGMSPSGYRRNLGIKV